MMEGFRLIVEFRDKSPDHTEFFSEKSDALQVAANYVTRSDTKRVEILEFRETTVFEAVNHA